MRCPAAVVQGIRDGTVDLKNPATTIALLKLDAVIGLKGTVQSVDGRDSLVRVGVTCALCHSTVDNSFATRHRQTPRRLAESRPRSGRDHRAIANDRRGDQALFRSWGPGRYDPRFNQDGLNGPQAIPPAYGLAGINRITSTGDGDEIAYWNRYVAVTQMGGHGTFTDPRIGVSVTNGNDDLVTSKLPALQAYQLSLPAPAAPAGSFDVTAAARGKQVFDGPGQCVLCHSGPEFTDANTRLHPPSDVVSEPEPAGTPSYASRSATKQYRTAPLRGIWQHPPYFHNGSAPTLEAVVRAYNARRTLGLSEPQIADLTEYLKSL